jgi:hypothetical protein
MVKRYYGGVISATQAVVNAVSASGFFSASQQMQAKQAGNWPIGPTPTPTPTVEYLVVAGGGGGGGVGNYNNGAGGGAGGYRTASGFAVASGTSITVTVGAGGSGGPGQINNTPADGSKGNDSVFSTITSTGGGYGTGNNAVATPGGRWFRRRRWLV